MKGKKQQDRSRLTPYFRNIKIRRRFRGLVRSIDIQETRRCYVLTLHCGEKIRIKKPILNVLLLSAILGGLFDESNIKRENH